MPDPRPVENDFLNKITNLIEENISNDQFGVSELAGKAGMSRSNLLRKIQKLAKVSASMFIRQVRLQNAMKLLKEGTLNVSEVSYEVGFSSTSYFIKCFREYYGYPPGEAGKRDSDVGDPVKPIQPFQGKKITITIGLGLAIILTVFLFLYKNSSSKEKTPEKSIAVLPFINDSNDSTNIYIINGLMESILNNLQQIKDLRVISRTSVEKYRNTSKTIPEIAQELNVSYFIEGSGQKIGDQILLNVQLIEAACDKHLWAEQYNKNTSEIFKLQIDVAKKITSEIQAIITPEEEKRINKVPTNNLLAYDYFLQGRNLLFQGTRESLQEAIPLFKKAIEQDKEFALAYADIAISYYYLDIAQVEKKYAQEINSYADKALLYDAQLPQSLVAKALYYMHCAEYEKAIPHLEKALEYNPNSAWVINLLSDFYTNYVPNTEKYLEYALKGIQLDIAANDSITASFIYLHISNAFIQTGFVAEAEMYINKSLEYHPENLYSEYVKAYILYAKNKDLAKTNKLLIKALSKDSARLDIMQEVAKTYYYQRDYQNAYKYYKKFVDIKRAYKLNIYPGEDSKIGVVYSEMEMAEDAEKLFKEYKSYAENDQSIYKHLSLAVYHSYAGNTKLAIEQLSLFSEQENYQYWIVLFLEIDPLMDNIKDHPEFKKLIEKIESKFWKTHKQMKAKLKKKGLL